jgi:hypothetical protein
LPITATSDLLLPGYWIDAASGAWCTLPWPDDPDEREAVARSSLGPALIDWAEGRTDEPGLVDYHSGGPWRFTPGQKRFLILWYHVSESGRFTYRSGVKRGAKGTGKDPFGAAWCNGELRGPVELYDWDDRSGRPVGRARGFPLVQVMSNSEAQSKDVLRIANAMWSAEARAYYDLDCGETRTVVRSGGRLEVPPSSEASAEGDPATAIMLNETHHMTRSSGGHNVAAVARRNVGKSPASIQARVLECTNAHRQGMDSVAEQSFVAWQKQLAPKYRGKRDILYDSVEAPPSTDIMTEDGRMAGLRAAYMDAAWSDLERLSDEMMDDRTSVADTIRYYLNGLASEEDSWIEPANFDALAAPGTVVQQGEQVALFLDCSKSEDATGLVACRLSDLFVFTVDCWQRPVGWDAKARGPWRVPRAEVDAKAREALERYDVAWFGIDPSPAQDDTDDALYWLTVIDGMHRDYARRLPVWATPGSSSVLFDMRTSQRGGQDRNRVFTEAAEYVQRLIDEDGTSGPLRHDGDSRLRSHTHNARNRPNPWGVSLAKVTRDSSKHIDLAVCMVGAVMGARIALNSGKVRRRRRGSETRRAVVM